jgi:hypothetical protein
MSRVFGRRSVRVGSLVGLAAALLFSGASEATAASSGTWVAYGWTNPITSSSSAWTCGATRTIAQGIYAQACNVRSTNRYVQGATIILNNSSSTYSSTAVAGIYPSGNGNGVPFGDWQCARKALATGWTLCFTASLQWPYSSYATGTANGLPLAQSPVNP